MNLKTSSFCYSQLYIILFRVIDILKLALLFKKDKKKKKTESVIFLKVLFLTQ